MCVLLAKQQPPSQSSLHRASLARAYLEAKYKNLNEESQDREESLRRIQILNARMDQMGIAESEREKYRQQVWQEVRKGCGGFCCTDYAALNLELNRSKRIYIVVDFFFYHFTTFWCVMFVHV